MLNYLRHIKHSTLRFLWTTLIKFSERKIHKITSGVVFNGPFKGLKLVNKNVFGSELPKLLGSYEKELNESLTSALKKQPKVVCNIGAAEGYYALGCARYSGVDQVLAFEALEYGRNLISDNLQANQIDSVISIMGLCNEQILWNTLNANLIGLMLIDIEGAELDILSRRNVALLEKTELIIESHDFCRPNCINTLKKLFEQTHKLRVISSKPRTAVDFPIKTWLPNRLKLELIDEKRPGTMQWLVCTPHNINHPYNEPTSTSN